LFESEFCEASPCLEDSEFGFVALLEFGSSEVGDGFEVVKG
jgi:hypothetical protein